MSYSGKLRERARSVYLRKRGMSYGEIIKHVHVSKDTLSRWCRDIHLSAQQEIRLTNLKALGQRKGSIVAAKNKRALRVRIIEKYKTESINFIGSISPRDELIAGIALYCGEGDKTDAKVGFTNSDPRLIVFMMKWFRVCCLVPEDRFRGAIWIHDNLDVTAAIDYWSSLTGISAVKFHKTYVVKNKESNKVRKNIHNYGIFSIRFSHALIHRRIMGWIFAIFGDKILVTLCVSAMIFKYSLIAQR